MSTKEVRALGRIKGILLQIGPSQPANMPSKISEMELTAHDFNESDSPMSRSQTESVDISDDQTLDTDSSDMQNHMILNLPAYIAGDELRGTLHVKSHKTLHIKSINIKLIGKGTTFYFKAKLRAQRLCEIIVPITSVQDCCVETNKEWKIPFTIKLQEDLPSTIDSGKKGKVTYFIAWDLISDHKTISSHEEVIILAKHSLDSLPRRSEMRGDNQEEEKYDLMKLEVYSPASAYLPGEKIQFMASIENTGKKPVKKIAVLLLQNVLFFKSGQNAKGRTKSYLMNSKDKAVNVKMNCKESWVDEIQLPDPIPPSAENFHRIDYELVLIAINKGKKSSVRALFDQARYHFDMEKYQDDYFRDFLPHAACHFEVGSNHGDMRSAALSGASAVIPLNDKWKSSDRKQCKQVPDTDSLPKMTRITFKP